MNKAIAKRWVKALRSNKYKQGRRALKQKINGTVRYCCLGVLTELYQNSMRRQRKRGLKETVCGDEIGSLTAFSARSKPPVQHTALLPTAVMKWAGIREHTGRYLDSNGVASFLSDDNDTGKSFKQIARIIETYADEL